jgi:membrane fusion protein (multidrug efflux system)
VSGLVERAPVAAGIRPRVSRKKLALAGAALLAGLGAARYGYDWWTEGRFIASTDDAYVGGNVTPVAPHVSGFVQQVLVEDNQHVAAGQILIRLDARDFEAALRHAEAVLDARRAAQDDLQARLELQHSVIREQEADLAAKRAQAGFAAADAVRYRTLAQSSAASRQDAQRSSTAEQEAQAAVAAAEAALEAGRQQLNVLGAGIAEAAAATAQARAELETARLNLGYTELRAPVAGYVGNRAAQVGAYVTAGTYLLSVVPAAGLWVDANFKEDQLTHMAPGQAATVVADVRPDRVLRGHVASLAPGTGAVFSVIPPENATGNFTKIVQRVPVRIVLDDGDATLGVLRPGLSTLVRVDTRAAGGVP